MKGFPTITLKTYKYMYNLQGGVYDNLNYILNGGAVTAVVRTPNVSDYFENQLRFHERRLKNNDEIGNYEFVKEYENLRKKQISSRMLSVHLLNKLSISKKETVSNIRKFGLSFLSNNQISKKIAMRFGMFQWWNIIFLNYNCHNVKSLLLRST